MKITTMTEAMDQIDQVTTKTGIVTAKTMDSKKKTGLVNYMAFACLQMDSKVLSNM